jgi:hypothetical protein
LMPLLLLVYLFLVSLDMHSSRTAFVSPDGVDIFVGENALVAHAVESGLLDEINDAADAAKTTAAAASTTGAGTQRCTERTRYG